MKNKNIGIIGFGRFGKTLYRLLRDDFKMVVYDTDSNLLSNFKFRAGSGGTEVVQEVFEKCRIIFYAIPIPVFESVIKEHRIYLQEHLLIDTCSVKMYPASVFKKYLKGTGARAMLCHPMFGPDSSKNGFEFLPLALDKFQASDEEYGFWKNYFREKGIIVISLKANVHDRLAASSHGLTHFIGRLLDEFGFKQTEIDTIGAKKLYEVMDQTCNDTWELFWSLQNYNPYTKEMRMKLGRAYDKLYNTLLSKDLLGENKVFGIQGGPGSFNDQAISDYVKHNDITRYKVKYLYTTEKVLSSLERGEINYGLFAIQNSIGGMVEESIEAMGAYKYKIKERLKIKIRHFLMKHKDVDLRDLRVIMGHPQVLIQCKHNLEKKYLQFYQESGEGDMIDTATAAKALAEGKISNDIAILGSKRISELYNLDIIDKDLQDDLHDERLNLTDFLLVERN
jgi:prephenate dehydratase/prephenate dehydrogenase